PVDRIAARRHVGQHSGGAALGPPGCSRLVHTQQLACLSHRPARTGGVVHEFQQAGLDRCIHARRDRASSQSQCAFPSCKCRAIACSATVACNWATRSRVSSNSICSGLLPERPGLDDSAASAPSLAVRQIEVTVVRSTRHFAAASRCVYWPVNTEVNTSYFCDGANKRLDLLPFFTFVFDDISILQTSKTRPHLDG